MKHIIASLILSAATLAGGLAHADDCGEKDRVPLPSCAFKGQSVVNRSPGLFVQNNCAYPITVKFAVPNLSDIRKDIPAGGRAEQNNIPLGSTTVSCCPRYNKCADPVPVASTGAGKQDTACWTPAFTNCVNSNGGNDAGAKLCYPNYTGCMAKYTTPTSKESTCWSQAFTACVASGNNTLAGMNACHGNYLGCLAK